MFREYLVKRLLYTIPVLVGLSLLIFILSRVIPGDPVRLALGPEATEEQVQALRHELRLDRPLAGQYLHWLAGIFRGDLGMSLRTRRNVAQDLREFFPATLELTTLAMLVAIAVGVPLGVAAAVRKDRATDHLSRILALYGVALPRFWLAILLQLLFAYELGLLPLVGRGPGPGTQITGLFLLDSVLTLDWEGFWTSLKHLALPVISLSLGSMAQIMRLTRSSMIEELRKDYVVAATAYGLPRAVVVYRYALKNAISSTLTVVGLSYGFLLGNAFLVETVFSWPGMASYGVQSVLYKDFNAVVGVTMVVGVVFAVANFLVDICYGYLDPRIKYGEE